MDVLRGFYAGYREFMVVVQTGSTKLEIVVLIEMFVVLAVDAVIRRCQFCDLFSIRSVTLATERNPF